MSITVSPTSATVGTKYTGVATITCDPVWTEDNGYEVDVLLTGNSDGFTMIEVDGTTTNIGGTPAVAGTCNVTCTVKDSNGNSASAIPAVITISAGAQVQLKSTSAPQSQVTKPAAQ